MTDLDEMSNMYRHIYVWSAALQIICVENVSENNNRCTMKLKLREVGAVTRIQ
jgi:hypothetical protein